MTCPYMDQCKSPTEPGSGPVYRRRFCEQQSHSECARFRLFRAGFDRPLPDWLRPTMLAHAEWLLESRDNSFVMPAQMPSLIPTVHG